MQHRGVSTRSDRHEGRFAGNARCVSRELRRRLIESGRFYIVQTNYGGVGALRVTIINPLTTTDDLDELLVTLRELGAELLKSDHP